MCVYNLVWTTGAQLRLETKALLVGIIVVVGSHRKRYPPWGVVRKETRGDTNKSVGRRTLVVT